MTSNTDKMTVAAGILEETTNIERIRVACAALAVDTFSSRSGVVSYEFSDSSFLDIHPNGRIETAQAINPLTGEVHRS